MSARQSQPAIIALVPDLLFGVRVRDVLAQLGYAAQVHETAAAARAALERVAAPDVALLIVDLRGPVADVADLVAAAKSLDAQLPVLAFGSHVDVERQQAARAAGVDRVVANSKFSADLPSLVSAMARTAPR